MSPGEILYRKGEKQMNFSDNCIYFDNAATTAMSKTALAAMLPFFRENYGNPSSVHMPGQKAAAAVFEARLEIARILNCAPSELYFTSGGSEADTQALFTAAEQGAKNNKRHIVASAIEHHAVLGTLAALEAQGFTVTLLSPGESGIIEPEQVEAALKPDTCLVSVMYANNETGALQPVSALGKTLHRRGILFHTDAVQAAGHIELDVEKECIDMLSVSAHKFHGPKGIGFLYVRGKLEPKRLIYGGGQERGCRAGTENVPAIAGMAAALKEQVQKLPETQAYVCALRDRLRAGLSEIEGARLNGSAANCLAGIANFSFPGVSGEALVSYLSMHGICSSSGSACSAGSVEPSHVLKAMGLEDNIAGSAIRFSLSEYNTMDEVEAVIRETAGAVKRLRGRV